MTQQVGFSAHLQDPVSGQPVPIKVWGTAARTGGEGNDHADQWVIHALTQGVTEVLAPALAASQVAMPTLAQSLAHFTPQIVAAANAALSEQGMQLTDVSLQCSVPESAVAPAAAAIAAAPTVGESVASSFASNVADEAASSIPTGVKVKMGGFNVNVGSDGVDGDSLADQVKDKVKSNLITYAIVGVTLLFFVFLCCGGIAYKLLFP